MQLSYHPRWHGLAPTPSPSHSSALCCYPPSHLTLLPPQADHQLALLQHGTRLYLVNMSHITHDLFYQLTLWRWEAVGCMQLASPLHVGVLMDLALQQEEAAGRWKVCWGWVW